MNGPRKVSGALIVLALLSLSAAPAQACCGWFKGCCGSTVNYAPVCAAPVCAPACAPCAVNYAPAPCSACQTVNYVPQTCYRTVYYAAPVVAYSPVAACGPCGATTVMRPVTTYVTQARVVAYTAYRPVVTAAYYAPYAQAAAPCCTAGYAPAAAPVQSQTQAAGQNGATNPTPAATEPGTTQPDSTDPGKTFAPAPSATDPQSRILLPPRSGSSNTTGAPRTLDSGHSQDRTTALPIRQAWSVRRASTISPAKPVTQTQDDGGWQSAN